MSIQRDIPVNRSPVNNAADEILKHWRTLKDKNGSFIVYPLVRRIWEGEGTSMPKEDEIPAILMAYDVPAHKIESTQFYSKNRETTFRIFIVLKDYRGDHAKDNGLIDLLEDHSRFLIKSLERPDAGNTVGFTPGNWYTFKHDQIIKPRLVRSFEGFSDRPITPPHYAIMFDLQLNISNHKGAS